jgi:plasmid stabilization system protein ParE
MAAIFATIEFIRRNPEVSPLIARISGVRGTLVRRYRFNVFYRVLSSEQTVEIVHVRHTARRPWGG